MGKLHGPHRHCMPVLFSRHPMKIMSDHRSSPGSVTDSKDFRVVAQAAGNTLKERLRVLDLNSNSSDDLAWSNIENYGDSLNEVIKQFSEYEFKKLHPDGDLHWTKVFVTIRAASFPENFWGKRSEDAWLLTLFADDPNDVGLSFSMHSKFTVTEGDIHLGYVVKKI